MSEDGRGGLLSAGGIFSIIAGVFEVIGGAMMLGVSLLGMAFWRENVPFFPRIESAFGFTPSFTMTIVIGGVVALLGIVAIVGGIAAIKRKSFSLSLLGAVCALIPINILGLLAVVFVSLGRREFGMVEEYIPSEE